MFGPRVPAVLSVLTVVTLSLAVTTALTGRAPSRTASGRAMGSVPTAQVSVVTDESLAVALLQACLGSERVRGGSKTTISTLDGWSVALAVALPDVRDVVLRGRTSAMTPKLTVADMWFVSGRKPSTNELATCVLGGSPEAGYGLLSGALGAAPLADGYLPARATQFMLLGAGIDNVSWGRYAAGVRSVRAGVGGQSTPTVAANGVWMSLIRGAEPLSTGLRGPTKEMGIVSVSALGDRDEVLSIETESESSLLGQHPCWVTPEQRHLATTVLPEGRDGSCGTAVQGVL